MEIKKFYKEGVEYTLPKFPSSNEVEEFEDKIKEAELLKPDSHVFSTVEEVTSKSLVYDDITNKEVLSFKVKPKTIGNDFYHNLYAGFVCKDANYVLVRNEGDTPIKADVISSNNPYDWSNGFFSWSLDLLPWEATVIKRNTNYTSTMFDIGTGGFDWEKENKLTFTFIKSNLKSEIDDYLIANSLHSIVSDSAEYAEESNYARTNIRLNKKRLSGYHWFAANWLPTGAVTTTHNKVRIKYEEWEVNAPFFVIQLPVNRWLYVYLKVKNLNEEEWTFEHNGNKLKKNIYYNMTIGAQENQSSNWSKYRRLNYLTELENWVIYDTDTFPTDWDNGKKIQINSSGMYEAGVNLLYFTSADIEIEWAVFDKEALNDSMFIANRADVAVNAIKSEYSKFIGIRPLNIPTTYFFDNSGKWTQLAPRISFTTRYSWTFICPAVTAEAGQRYAVLCNPLNNMLEKWVKKVFVKVKQTNTSPFTWRLNEVHTSYNDHARWPGAWFKVMRINDINNKKEFHFVIDLEAMTAWRDTTRQMYLLIATLTNETGVEANDISVEMYYIDNESVNIFDVDTYYTKREVDDMLNWGTSNYITFWWDSLTAGGGWTSRLASLAGMTERNGWTGGESSATILARQGWDVMLVNNITIPADTTEVRIAKRDIDGGILTYEGKKVTPLLQGWAHVNPVKIGDIEGTLRCTGSSDAEWLFKRTVAGAEKVIDRPTAMTTAFDRLYNAPYLQVIFIGQNGWYSDLDDLVRQHRLIIEHSKAKHTVVLWLSSGTKEGRAEYEARMKKEFGRYFICLREYLATPIYDENGEIISCYGMKDQNVEIDPSYSRQGKTTKEEITEGTCPHQILADSVHYTTGTKQVIGDYVFKRCKELGIF